jgi:hypothetical protein
MINDIETQNAIITSATITNDDHGVLSAWVMLDYGGSGQGFGGWTLYVPKSFRHHNNQQNFAGHFIYRVMEIAGVNKWHDLVGKAVRVRSSYSKVLAIGHILNDDWFDPTKDFQQMIGEQ